MDDMTGMVMPPDDGAIGSHGMQIIGGGPMYLSHLPMFMHPHNFQVIFEVTFANGGTDPQALYVEDRQQTGTKLYTFQPADEWDINELAPMGPLHQPARTSFAGTIWRNHFERHPLTHPGQRRRIAEARAQVQRVVYFQQLDAQTPASPQLSYLLFGQAPELFLAHLITRPPDFDQILSARIDHGHESLLSDEQLRQGIVAAFPGRPDDLPHKIQAGEKLVGRVAHWGEAAAATNELPLEADIEFYVETEDLAGQM